MCWSLLLFKLQAAILQPFNKETATQLSSCRIIFLASGLIKSLNYIIKRYLGDV